MSADFVGRVPTLWHGRGAASETIARLTGDGDALLIADESISGSALVGRMSRAISVEARGLDVATVTSVAQEISRRPPKVIVALGGGSVLDAAKIASLVLAPGRSFDFILERAARSALTILPDAPPPVDIIAVPTTIGTSSETNSVGVLKNGAGYRLVIGRSLRPRHAVLDPCCLASLSSAAVREGALEAILRVAGASTSARRSSSARRDAVGLGVALLETASAEVNSPAARLRLARLSASTQRTAALRGHDPYSARHWYLANEAAFVLGVRKMVATAAVVAAVWRRICAGDPRWGDRLSLESFWSALAGRAALPVDPPVGIAALIDRWRIPRPPRPPERVISRIASATETAWGNRYPMLAGLVAEDFCELLRDSYWSQGGE